MENYYYKNQPTNYFITEDGKCYNQKTKKWLKGTVSHNGYLVYTLTIEGKSKKIIRSSDGNGNLLSLRK